MNPEKLTNYLNSVLDREVPSFDCIVYRDHEMIYRHMGGTVDIDRKQKVSTEDQYLMFSMTKVMTMCCIMQLVEQGKVSLDDPVSKFLPAYGKLTVMTDGGSKPAENTMLIRHLVSMQSGLDYDLERAGIRRVLKEKGGEATTLELVNAFTETPLLFEPGTRFQYSLSHDVVAAVIEVVSGMTFGEYLKKNLWEPLGIKRTFFAKPMNDGTPHLAQQFICNAEGHIVPMEQSCGYQLSERYESGGAGLVSCTEDYAIFGDALACAGVAKNGARILKPETIEIMRTNLLGEVSRKDIVDKMGRLGHGYGCGVQVLMEPELVGSPAPTGIFGWDGAAGSCIMMSPDQKMSFVYTQHVRNCGFAYHEIHLAVRDIVFGS